MLFMQDSGTSSDRDKEITQNYKAFVAKLPKLIVQHRDKYALMRHREVIGIYSTAEDAVQTGGLLYEDGLFSVQQITDVDVDMGYYSHVASIW